MKIPKRFHFVILFFQICGFYPVTIYDTTSYSASHTRNRHSSRYSTTTTHPSAHHPNPNKMQKKNVNDDDRQIDGGHHHKDRPKKLCNKKIFLVFWTYCQIIILIAGTTIILIYENTIFSKDGIGKFSDMLQTFSLVIANYVILVEVLVRRHHFTKIWHYVEMIECRFGDAVNYNLEFWKPFWRRFMIRFVFLVFMCVFIEANVINEILGVDQQWTYFWETNIFSLVMTRVWQLQHMFYVNLIAINLEIIKVNLKVLAGESKRPMNKVKRNQIYDRIRMYKDVHNIVWRILWSVNKIFCWSQLVNLTQMFVELTCVVYWIYYYYYIHVLTFGKLFYVKYSTFVCKIFMNNLSSFL